MRGTHANMKITIYHRGGGGQGGEGGQSICGEHVGLSGNGGGISRRQQSI